MVDKNAKANVSSGGVTAEASGSGALAVGARGHVTAIGDTVAVASEGSVRAAASQLSERAQEVFAEVGRLSEDERAMMLRCIAALEKDGDNDVPPEAKANAAAELTLPPAVKRSSMQWERLVALLTAVAKLPLKEIGGFLSELLGKI